MSARIYVDKVDGSQDVSEILLLSTDVYATTTALETAFPAAATANVNALANTTADGLVQSNGYAWYKVGKFGVQVAPPTMTTAASFTIANLLKGLIVATPTATGATIAYTLPTGTLMDGGVSLPLDGAFDWSITNLGANAVDIITVTAATGHTIVGNALVQSAHSSTGGAMGNTAVFRSRRSAANTWISYRVG